VLTSSMAAITDEPETGRVLTEADWNTKSSLSRNPYYFSKVLAEREAWRFVEEEKPRFDLVAVNPFMVIGPSLSRALNTSPKIFVDLAKGVYPGVFALTWGFVDVRDVADAHVRAMETPGASGRYICAGDRLSMRDVVGVMREAGVGGRLPRLAMDGAVGTGLVKLLSYFQPAGVGSYLRSHLGRVPSYDNARIRRELGQTFRPARDSIQDTVADLRRWGHLPEA